MVEVEEVVALVLVVLVVRVVGVAEGLLSGALPSVSLSPGAPAVPPTEGGGPLAEGGGPR